VSVSVADRARIHAALGDAARLAIVDGLMVGDASPGEIAEWLNLPTNLVAHHLKVLQAAGVLTRHRSEGDARRSYVRLVPETLATIRPPRLPPVERVVFVCTHNSARSQLAAALWAGRSDVPAASAGTEPARRIHPRTTAVARRHGLALLSKTTADVAAVVHDRDLVVAVCDNAHEHLPRDPGRLHWSVPDPARTNTDAAFEAAYAELSGRVDRLVPVIDIGDRP
jgi:protein-tyrosine-phosphatase